jgi:phytoene dehydrogenase-like protein
MENYDIIICGGGHNGLTCGAYLTKAGLSVLVVERRPVVGGGVVTESIFSDKGFKVDLGGHAHALIQANPMITDNELELDRFGLEYIYPEYLYGHPFLDGSYIIQSRDVNKTCDSLAKFSQRDASSFLELYNLFLKFKDMIVTLLFSPPPPLSEMIKGLESSEDGRELLRIMLQSPIDFVNERFENDKVKAWLYWWGLQIGGRPDQEGTALLFMCLLTLVQHFGFGYPKGGGGKLSEALAKYITSNGGTIRTNAKVKRVIVENGRAKGIELSDGEIIFAKKGIVSNIHLKLLFPEMVGRENVSSSFIKSVERFKIGFSGFGIHLALNEALRFKVEEINKCSVFAVAESVSDVLENYDDIVKGNPFSKEPLVIGVCSTIDDPTRAPDGKHVLFLFRFVPYNIGNMKWKGAREKVAGDMMEKLKRYAPNMDDKNIIGKFIDDPVTIEARNPCMIRGDIFQGDISLYQFGPMRPLIRFNYKMPVEGLYLCGPSTHPGGSVTGGGRACAKAVLKDLGL